VSARLWLSTSGTSPSAKHPCPHFTVCVRCGATLSMRRERAPMSRLFRGDWSFFQAA
jgi:hypothetical protein